MAAPDLQAETPPPAATHRPARGSRRRWLRRLAEGAAGIALVAAGALWLAREDIARDVIDDYLGSAGVPARYDIIAIGPREQVIANLVIGDPARPDFTARRVVVTTGVGWAGPELRRLEVEGARLFASYRGGRFSLGALDPLVFTKSDAPPALPAVDLELKDARGLIESDYGRIGVRLEGAGRLDDGFAGVLGATAPGFGIEGCRAERATLFGELSTRNGAPRLSGPLRLGGLACQGVRAAQLAAGVKAQLSRDLAGAKGDLAIEGGGISLETLAAARLGGTLRFSWNKAAAALAHDLALADLRTPQGRLDRLSAEGRWRGAGDLARGQWEGQVRASGIAPAHPLGPSLAPARASLEGTLLAPLLAQASAAFDRAINRASLAAEAIIRHRAGEARLIVPEARITAAGGERIAALSQVSADIGAAGLGALRGNLLIGGEGLPQLNARIAPAPGGGWSARLAMADYAAGANRVAIPRLALMQERGGALRFDGLLAASGALPGGMLSDLSLPLEGRWSQAGGLALGTRCTAIRFGALALSGLALKGQSITLCPERGAPMLAYDRALRLAARSGPITLAGTLGENPARIAAKGLALRYPSPFAATALAVEIGADGSAVALSAASLTGRMDGGAGGAFAGGAARIAAVPFDLSAISGRWRFTDGVLRIDDGAFTLTDRPAGGVARFAPLSAQRAALSLDGNRIAATATLAHPGSGRRVVEVALSHDLEKASGRALLSVPGIAFGDDLQPEDLTYLAKGVVALAKGTISGEGEVAWRGDDVTSRGRLRSDGFDFAAAFGPVRGLKGEVVFTDLLDLTTAPDQTVTIAAINPGVEVLDGRVRFDLSGGTRLALHEARFPFMGGSLSLRPLVMDFSRSEERRYVFEITGLDAATFVAQMELTNLGATGTFDGIVPVVFDANGNGRIARGVLVSRPGGGNVAYIGELSYEDLGAIGNYAFAALRSLDYRRMEVGLNGDLAGEIVTNFDFDGVRQGAGTSRDFLTRQLARLPIRFKVNVRSENFYELATMVRSFWDAEYLGNPVDKGLLTTKGGRLVPARERQPSVQPSESESQP